MFGMRTKRIAESVSQNADQYAPGSASYSPNYTTDEQDASLGRPSVDYHRPSPQDQSSDAPTVVVPRPPLPSVGGEHGLNRGFGYSTGLLPSRAMRNRFGGETLVVPTMGVHPQQGPVGRSSRQDRLQSGVNALVDQWLPAQQDIYETFTQPAGRNRNPLDKD